MGSLPNPPFHSCSTSNDIAVSVSDSRPPTVVTVSGAGRSPGASIDITGGKNGLAVGGAFAEGGGFGQAVGGFGRIPAPIISRSNLHVRIGLALFAFFSICVNKGACIVIAEHKETDREP